MLKYLLKNMKFLVLAICLSVSESYVINYYTTNGIGGKVKTTSREIGSDDLPAATIGIGIGYPPKEAHIYSITNIDTLERVVITNFKKDYIPLFQNVPKLRELFVEQSSVTRIPYGKISDTLIRRVYLQNNQINHIEPGAFGLDVDEAHLACNELTEINSDWFQIPAKLKHFHISGNRLTHVKENAMLEFTNLLHITLGFNDMLTIGPNAFPPTFRMDGISLFNNNLKELNGNTFPRRQHLNYLDIRFNNLTYLPKNLRDKLTIDGLYFDKNPWQCSCRDEIINWLNSTHYAWPSAKPDHAKLKCVYPTDDIDCKESHSDDAVVLFNKNSDFDVPTRNRYCNGQKGVCCVVTEQIETLFTKEGYKEYVLA